MTQTLVLVEHESGRVRGPSLHAITAAAQMAGETALMVLGSDLGTIASPLRGLGASKVLIADHPALKHPLADRYAAVIAQVTTDIRATAVIATSSTFTRDVLPRVAALLDAPMLSDVLSIDPQDDVIVCRRPVYAGSAVATVTLAGARRVLAIRAAAFDPPVLGDTTPCPVELIDIDTGSLPDGMEFVSAEQRQSGRPELIEARIVVGGGRPLKDRETFERLIGALADALGGAIGATRAAVDAGIAPNNWQVGQTGKVIAPDLYIAVGISGAVQHLAGIKDARVIVAINKDANAPIFNMATYGLEGDLFELVPELIAAVRRHHSQTAGD